jgi:glyoxalase family protein
MSHWNGAPRQDVPLSRSKRDDIPTCHRRPRQWDFLPAPPGTGTGTLATPTLTKETPHANNQRRGDLRKLQAQGVHHITLVGADRQTSIDFWEGVLGMPFVFEQPNLDRATESHLYFDPGDGRLITIFTNEERTPDPTRTPTDPGCVHHIAFNVSQATFNQAVQRLDERGIKHSGVKDRGFMDSIYFEDPLGLLIELASYRFEPPFGHTHADVLFEAHKLRVERGDYNIDQVHLADAIEGLILRFRPSLSEDRTPKDPYTK